jgi:hypothetical protein
MPLADELLLMSIEPEGPDSIDLSNRSQERADGYEVVEVDTLDAY